RQALARRWQELETQFDVDTGAALTRRYIADMAQGFGLSAKPVVTAETAAAGQDAPASLTDAQPALERVRGQVLEVVEPPAKDGSRQYWLLVLMLLLVLAGGLRQAFHPSMRHLPRV